MISFPHQLDSPSSLKTLNDHIGKLEHHYDVLNEEMGKGEVASFGTTPASECPTNFSINNAHGVSFCFLRWWTAAHQKMNEATYVFET